MSVSCCSSTQLKHAPSLRPLGVIVLCVPHDAYSTRANAHLASCQNMGAEWPSIEWQIQVVEIVYQKRWKVHVKDQEISEELIAL